MLILGKVQGKTLQVEKEDGLFTYYLDDEKIGVWDPKVLMDRILYLQQFKENDSIKDEIKDIIEQTPEETLINMPEQLKNQEIEELKQVLKLSDKEKVKQVSLVNLQEKLKEEDKPDKERDNEQEKEGKDKKDESEVVNLPANNRLTIKQEAKLNKKVNDVKTLGQVLQREGLIPQDGKDYVTLGVVEASDLNQLADEQGKKHENLTTRYAMVAIATDGTMTKLDVPMDYGEGNNPGEINPLVKRNGEVEQDTVLSQFRVGKGAISIGNGGPGGEIELFYTSQKTRGTEGIEGNKTGVQTQITTSQVYDMEIEERRLNAEYEGMYHSDEKQKEAQMHEDCEETKLEDVNGDLSDSSHHDCVYTENEIITSTGETMSFREIATKWGYIDENGQPDAERAKEKFTEEWERDSERKPEDVVEEVEEEFAEQMPQHGRII